MSSTFPPLPTEDQFELMNMANNDYLTAMHQDISNVGIVYMDIVPAIPQKQKKNNEYSKIVKKKKQKKMSDSSVYSEVDDSLLGPFPKKPVVPPKLPPPRRYVKQVADLMITSTKKKDWFGLVYRLLLVACCIASAGLIIATIYIRKVQPVDTFTTLFGADVTLKDNITWLMALSTASLTIVSFCILMYNKDRSYVYVSLVTTSMLVVFILSLILMFNDVRINVNDSEYERKIIKVYGYDLEITEVIDDVQSRLECCGAYGNITHESAYSWGIWKLNSKWFIFHGKRHDPIKYVPSSCCLPGVSEETCQSTHTRSIPSYGPPIIHGVRYNPSLYTNGCLPTIKDKLYQLRYYVKVLKLANICTSSIIISLCIFLIIAVLYRQGFSKWCVIKKKYVATPSMYIPR